MHLPCFFVKNKTKQKCNKVSFLSFAQNNLHVLLEKGICLSKKAKNTNTRGQ